MPDVGFGGLDNIYTWSGLTPTYTPNAATIPAGRAMANGSTAVIPTALLGYCAGRGGGCNVYLSFGSGPTGWFGIGSSTHGAHATGWQGSGGWVANGGSHTFTITHDGPIYHARSAGGGTTYDAGGAIGTGVLGGSFRYVQAPTAPGSLTLSLTGVPNQVQMVATAPSDNGGTGVNGYRFRWWYQDAPGTKFDVDSAGLSTTITAQPGRTVEADCAAKNWVTDAVGTVGVRTAVKSIFVPSGGKVRDTTWKAAIARVWDTGINGWRSLKTSVRDTTWKDTI